MSVLVTACAVLSDLAAGADGVANQLHDGVLVAFDALGPVSRSRISLADETMDALDYPPGSETVLAFRLEANDDGKDDYIVTSPGGSLCGTGGCPYVLVDGRSGIEIGEFFGTVAILNTRINDHRVVQVLSKRDLESATLQTYVFDRETYQLVSSVLMQELGVADWQRHLIPAPPARPGGP